MKNILFIASHRKDRAPGQRFRFEQYFNFLEQNGFHCELSYIISEGDDKILYSPGNYFNKCGIALKAAFIRLRNIIQKDKYDIIFIFREGYLTGTTFFENLLAKSRAKIVFDFDDAIWHLDVSEANRSMGWLKNPGKTAKLISISDMVFAGNEYLADYARHHNDNVVIIPTTIDTDEYAPVPFREKYPVCIGWSGSITTIRHFETAIPVLKRLKAAFGDKIIFKVIGDRSYRNHDLGITGIPWTKEDELKELGEIDIGIMPLPDDEWAKGKCGLKGLQYMALNIATVMSPVGVNTEIIKDGINGMLASDENEWFEKLSQLIENPQLRKNLADAGRKTVVDHYSVKSQEGRYLGYFRQLINTN